MELAAVSAAPECRISWAQHRGYRVWSCCSCSVGPNCGLDLIPGPGTPYAPGQPKKKKKEKKRKKKRKKGGWGQWEIGWGIDGWRPTPLLHLKILPAFFSLRQGPCMCQALFFPPVDFLALRVKCGNPIQRWGLLWPVRVRLFMT